MLMLFVLDVVFEERDYQGWNCCSEADGTVV